VRIEPVSLETLLREAGETAARLRHQLATMSEEVAVYKGLDRARSHIVSLLVR